MHEVRPWLTGRLDFAPVIAFAGDADFPLRGGTVEYFLDRRAAVAVYGRRPHVITLIVARADGLPWPAGRPLLTRAQGFNVRLWRSGELAYALVSDLDAREPGPAGRSPRRMTVCPAPPPSVEDHSSTRSWASWLAGPAPRSSARCAAGGSGAPPRWSRVAPAWSDSERTTSSDSTAVDMRARVLHHAVVTLLDRAVAPRPR